MSTAPTSPPSLGDWGGKRPENTPENAVFLALAEDLAWATVLRLTAGAVVTAPTTVEPRCDFGYGYDQWPVFSSTGRAADIYGARSVCTVTDGAVHLQRPVGRVAEVKINGVAVTPSAYRIEDGNQLVRTDGGAWPTCDGDRLTVSYYRGARPDHLLVWATGQLAFEFYLAMAPKTSGTPFKAVACRLPAGVTSVVRQGVTYEVNNLPFTAGRTGIVEIDAVLARYNPNGLSARPTVLSVDTARRAPRVIPTVYPPATSSVPPPLGQGPLASGVTLALTRGADFDGVFVYRAGSAGNEQPVDLTGWTAAAQVRESVGGAIWLTLTSGQEITLGSDGTVSLHFSHTRTEGPEWDTRKQGVWDLELTSPTQRRIRFAEGIVRVSQDVTRG